MFEERYAKMNEGLHPGKDAVRRVLAAGKPQTSHPPLSRRWLVAALSLMLVLLAGTAVAAHGEYDFSDLLRRWFPMTASSFSPVHLSDTRQGVTMTVLQANLTETGKVELIVGFSGDRVDENSLPGLGYGAHMLFHEKMIQGDITPENSPYPLIWRFIVSPGEEDADWYDTNGYFTLSMTRFDIGRQTNIETYSFDLSAVPQPALQQVQGISVTGIINPNEKESITTLVPGEPLAELTEGMAVTAIGYLPDGQFVLQSRIPIDRPLGNTCSAWLVSRKDDYSIPAESGRRMWWDEENGWIYSEVLYDIPAQKLPAYQLHTVCITVAETLTDEWHVTIDMNSLTTKAE